MSRVGIPHSERLLVIVGPSGAGKDSVLAAWRQRLHGHDVHFARRVITREAHASEGHDSVDADGFRHLQARGELAMWWHAHGLHYGVRRSELAVLSRGGWAVVNGSRAHLATLRQQAPHLHAVQITAPPALLSMRLAERARENAEAVAQRLARRLEVPVALELCNVQALSHTVDALHAWWLRQCAETATARA